MGDRQRLYEAAALLKSCGFRLQGQIDAPGGGETFYDLSPEQVVSITFDPTGFAAQTFGCSREEYLEWVRLNGAPLCAAKTRSGRLCSNGIARGQQQLPAWLELHRSDYCGVHS